MNTTASSAEQPMVARERAGIRCGLLAGIVMGVIMMGHAVLVLGLDPWAGPKMAWSLVAGPEAIRPGFEPLPVAGGLLIHFALSALYGFVFEWIVPYTVLGHAIFGLFFGYALYTLNIVMVPMLFPRWAGHLFPPTMALHFLAVAEHLGFGAALAFFYRYRH
jgi:hypothetical protein